MTIQGRVLAKLPSRILGTGGIDVSLANGVYTIDGSEISSELAFNLETNAQIGTSYTLVQADNGKLVTLNNASAISLMVPVGLDAGFYCMIAQLGAGQVTIIPDGVSVNSLDGALKLTGQYAAATLASYSANVYLLTGTIST